MINGTHIVIYSDDAEADRAFFRDVLEIPHIDSGGGWLIFSLPPSELGVHPAMPGAAGGKHEFYLMVDDIGAFTARMGEKDVPFTPVEEHEWGKVVGITLPGGSTLGVYQPLHQRPPV